MKQKEKNETEREREKCHIPNNRRHQKADSTLKDASGSFERTRPNGDCGKGCVDL
jgi:hypothetical protein